MKPPSGLRPPPIAESGAFAGIHFWATCWFAPKQLIRCKNEGLGLAIALQASAVSTTMRKRALQPADPAFRSSTVEGSRQHASQAIGQPFRRIKRYSACPLRLRTSCPDSREGPLRLSHRPPPPGAGRSRRSGCCLPAEVQPVTWDWSSSFRYPHRICRLRAPAGSPCRSSRDPRY